MRYRNYVKMNNVGDADFPIERFDERFLYPEIVPDINTPSSTDRRTGTVARDPRTTTIPTRVKPTSVRVSSSDRTSRSSYDRSKPYSQGGQQEGPAPAADPAAASNKTFMIVAIAAVGLTLVYITIKKLAS